MSRQAWIDSLEPGTILQYAAQAYGGTLFSTLKEDASLEDLESYFESRGKAGQSTSKTAAAKKAENSPDVESSKPKKRAAKKKAETSPEMEGSKPKKARSPNRVWTDEQIQKVKASMLPIKGVWKANPNSTVAFKKEFKCSQDEIHSLYKRVRREMPPPSTDSTLRIPLQDVNR
jgi:hypothetical protein